MAGPPGNRTYDCRTRSVAGSRTAPSDERGLTLEEIDADTLFQLEINDPNFAAFEAWFVEGEANEALRNGTAALTISAFLHGITEKVA